MSAATVFILMAKEIRDARKNRWFVVISSLFALLAVSFSLLGLSGIGSLGITGFGRTAASLLNLVILIVPLMGLLLGSMSLVGEREQGTLETLLAQPITVAEIFLGKYLGAAVAMTLTLLLGFAVSGFVIAHYAGANQIGDYWILVLYTLLLGLVFLSLGFFFSIFTRRHTMAIGLALFLWFLFIFLSDLGLIGTSLVLKLTPRQLFWLVAANPVQSVKLAVAGSLQKSLESFGAAGVYASDLLGNWLSAALTAILAAWVLAPLLLALFIFRSRCAE